MKSLLDFLAHGLLHLGWLQITAITLIATHITIVCTTLYLHRSQTHRGVDFHPVVAHFFRLWLWLTTGMTTREWVAVHRKHHAHCEREGDPHSPRIFGAMRVFLRGADLYREEVARKETLERYGNGTPDDWIERHLYTPHSVLGIMIMLAIDVLAFGAIGLTVWAVQMAWIPFWAAGVVNGLGHFIGYRNFSSPDASTNLFPLGLVIGGEELHNNHHAHATSAKFSSKWYEFDIGWGYIRILQALRLARVRRVAPRAAVRSLPRADVDIAMLQAVQTHRYALMRRFGRVLKKTALRELRALSRVADKASVSARKSTLRKLLRLPEELLGADELRQLESAMQGMRQLNAVVAMRRSLAGIWGSSLESSEQILARLQAWIEEARSSSVVELTHFARHLSRL
ncbi:fatty acid desaturase [Bordetella sp. N]|uniref:DesA family fatty acid desaturase n=1 Tax=Bordetella sp. N TaxID=1746199 RepID=UPI00070AE4A9|nr:fatty acid desaturase [Bordetella sp. N]ALM86113.1 aminotransferase [Bordetella sp. N]